MTKGTFESLIFDKKNSNDLKPIPNINQVVSRLPRPFINIVIGAHPISLVGKIIKHCGSIKMLGSIM